MDSEKQDKGQAQLAHKAFLFILLMAFVSLFSDMTHEGANSVNGAFESFLGAPDMVIAIVGGSATLLGCSLRFLTGYWADKTKRYWPITIVGYAVDLVAVPLLAVVPNDPEKGWILAVVFILMEKVGKAIKKPAKDTLVSFAATRRGVGKSFAITELLDQIGAVLGPLILTGTYLIFASYDQYRRFVIGFLALGIPALICFGLLIISRLAFPDPSGFEKKSKRPEIGLVHSLPFTLFVLASSLLAFGLIDSFAVMSKDFYSNHILGEANDNYIPLLYSYAMLVDALAAVLFGFLYDRIGFWSIVIAIALTSPYAFFVFYMSGIQGVSIGLTLWGIGMGAEESVMKSGITSLSGKDQRARAFGFHELCYGIAAFLGSFIIGWLYEIDARLSLSIYCTAFGLAATIIYMVVALVSQKTEATTN